MANKTKKPEVSEDGEPLIVPVGFTVTESMRRRLDGFCKQRERGVSWICRKAVLEYMDRAEA
jgi:hypothetical protein